MTQELARDVHVIVNGEGREGVGVGKLRPFYSVECYLLSNQPKGSMVKHLNTGGRILSSIGGRGGLGLLLCSQYFRLSDISSGEVET
jgi:hypothetical protein